MGAYVIWFPHNQIRVLVFRFITVLPAVIVIGGWIVLQIYLGAGSFGKKGESGGVAYLAHVGGAVTGILTAFLFYGRAQYTKAMDAHQRGWKPHSHEDLFLNEPTQPRQTSEGPQQPDASVRRTLTSHDIVKGLRARSSE